MNPVSRSFLGAIALVSIAVLAAAAPQPVPKLTDRVLTQTDYVQLAKEWKRHIAESGASVEAYVNLAMAYDYSGEPEAALQTGRLAVELAPKNADALNILGKMVSKYGDDEEEAVELLERCIKSAPDHADGLITLAGISLWAGRLDRAEEVLGRVHNQNVFPRPLQDYAYNMLVGLPEDAVLITNGDNDTFPPLALQAGMGFRTDVVILNASLLNSTGYAEAQFEKHAAIRPKGGWEPVEGRRVSGVIIEKLVQEKRAPVYFAVTLVLGNLGFPPPELVVEGMNQRTFDGGLSAEESARLFLDTYRMDSATDWGFPWSLKPSVPGLLENYASSMIHIVEQDGLSDASRGRLLVLASQIAEFHKMEHASQVIGSLKTK